MSEEAQPGSFIRDKETEGETEIERGEGQRGEVCIISTEDKAGG